MTIILHPDRLLLPGGLVADHLAVVVRRDRIVDVIPIAEVSDLVEGTAQHHVLTGCTLLPGLIDMHVHLTYGEEPSDQQARLSLRAAYNSERALSHGITTLRDLGSRHGVAIPVRDAINAGRANGPRVFASALQICATGGHGSEYEGYGDECDGLDECRRGVRRQLKAGADLIKVITNGVRAFQELRNEEVAAVADEAHRAGVRVACHASIPSSVAAAIAAGVDTIEHGCAFTSEDAKRMSDKGITLVPTLSVFNGWRRRDERGGTIPPFPDIYRKHAQSVQAAISAGVTIGAGTDYAAASGLFESLPAELEALVEVGLSAVDALRAATEYAGSALGTVSGLGTIARGAPADLIAVRGMPDQQIERVRDIRFVMIRGEITTHFEP